MNKGGFQVKKVTLLILAVMLVSTLLMASAPPDHRWQIWETNKKPKPSWVYSQEVNNGEPGMEKVVFFNQVNLVYGNQVLLEESESPPIHPSEYMYFKSSGALYYWYIKQTVRVPERGLCQWRYTYD
jgi:hypothetical protein